MKRSGIVTLWAVVLGLLILGGPDLARCGNLLYEDDFSDPESGWPAGENEKVGKLGYVDGKYVVRTNKPWPAMVFGNPEIDLADLDLSVTATQVAAPANNNNSFGVLIRYTEWIKPYCAYAFLISGDGYWSILKIADQKIVDLIYWAFSPAIRQGNDANTLRVVAQGTSLYFLVNSVFLGGVIDYRLMNGDIGLVAISYEADPVEIHFDNLTVSAP